MPGDRIGRLSRHRDGETFPAFLDRLNDEWVAAVRRISPHLLIGQIQAAGGQIAEFWQAVDPDALGEPVSRAGPGPAPAWLQQMFHEPRTGSWPASLDVTKMGIPPFYPWYSVNSGPWARQAGGFMCMFSAAPAAGNAVAEPVGAQRDALCPAECRRPV